MAVDECCSVCTMILPEGTNNLQQHESHSAKSLSCGHTPKKSVKNMNAACIPDVDIEKGKSDVLRTAEERRTDSTARAQLRQSYSLIWRKAIQMVINRSTELPRFTSRGTSPVERAHDVSSNRSRKYRRSSSFNSRRVILLSSILSIAGTLILIYLTLRVRQTNQ